MIPTNITRQHLLAAIAEIDRSGIPAARKSRTFVVDYNRSHYPPKYVVSLANKYANGIELPFSEFNGGAETNNFLRSLDFTVIRLRASAGGTTIAQAPKARPQKPTGRLGTPSALAHTGERCKDCKRVLKRLLEQLYGSVQQDCRLDLGTRPEDYDSASCHGDLERVYSALQRHRGFADFVAAKTLPPSDFFVPDPGFLVEVDESQHFTELRSLALSLYPTDLHFAFDVEAWMKLCDKIRARDQDPPHRDEQRAWYDTLRDFAPHATATYPTIRLHAAGFRLGDRAIEWCSLDPANPNDVETFRHIIGEWADFWHFDYKIWNGAELVRVAIDGAWRGNKVLAKKLLRDIADHWPSGIRVQCLSTCGAFIVFDWPDAIPQQQDNRFPSDEAAEHLDFVATEHVRRLLKDGLREKLSRCSDYLTIGVDSSKSQISSTDARISENHAELVYIINLNTGDIHFTGKSYPTPNQESGLFRVVDLGSHFIALNDVPTMILGCHDLTIFNPRSDATASGWRLKTKSEFKSLAKKQQPRWVLHHPHSTVNPMTWRHAWNGLRSELSTVTSYLGTGCYSYQDSKNGLKRKPLQAVLDSTKSHGVGDVVVKLAGR